jgi:hypothetical protein
MGPLDIDAYINPRATTVKSSILRHIRHGRVRESYSIGDTGPDQAQVLRDIAYFRVRYRLSRRGTLIGALMKQGQSCAPDRWERGRRGGHRHLRCRDGIQKSNDCCRSRWSFSEWTGLSAYHFFVIWWGSGLVRYWCQQRMRLISDHLRCGCSFMGSFFARVPYAFFDRSGNGGYVHRLALHAASAWALAAFLVCCRCCAAFLWRLGNTRTFTDTWFHGVGCTNTIDGLVQLHILPRAASLTPFIGWIGGCWSGSRLWTLGGFWSAGRLAAHENAKNTKQLSSFSFNLISVLVILSPTCLTRRFVRDLCYLCSMIKSAPSI